MTNTDKQLTVIAFLRAKNGKSEQLGKRLLDVVEATRRESGNINYDLHRSNEDPNIWALYENWHSETDLEAHFNMSYLKRLLSDLQELTDGPPDIRRLTMVSACAQNYPYS